MSEFDLKAGEWDKSNIHIERSRAIAEAIKDRIDIRNGMKALEYGAGTGLLSFMLNDRLADITLMDSSEGMLNVLIEKIRESGAENMHPVLFDLEKDDFTAGRFDMVYSQMVLHHVADVNSLLVKFYGLLNTGGILAVADLYKEDGSFHGEGFTGHKGFNPEKLVKFLQSVGFNRVQSKTSYVIRRIDENGHHREYPLFLITAYKSNS